MKYFKIIETVSSIFQVAKSSNNNCYGIMTIKKSLPFKAN